MIYRILFSILALALTVPWAVSAEEAEGKAMEAMEMKTDEMMGKSDQMANEEMNENEPMMMEEMMEPQEVGNTVCPVDGKPIKEEEAFKMEHKGKIYNLDSAACVQKFAEDPEKYIATLPQEEMKAVETKAEEMKTQEMPKAPAAEMKDMPAEKN